jgi:hypothetical protein
MATMLAGHGTEMLRIGAYRHICGAGTSVKTDENR